MAEQIHTIKIEIDKRGMSTITLNGEPISNVAEAVVHLTPRGASVVLTIVGVEVKVVGEMERPKVTTRTEEYKAPGW